MNIATEAAPQRTVAMVDPGLADELRELNASLRRMEEAVVGLERRVESVEELREDIWPAVQGMAHHLNTTLVELEESGSIAFAKEAVGVAQAISTSFTPEEVRELGDGIVGILHTVRRVTQPELLDVVDRAAVAVSAPETPGSKPRIFKALRDPDVRRGMARMLAVLKVLGSDHRAGDLPRTRNTPHHLNPPASPADSKE